jgi:hypothetical protein
VYSTSPEIFVPVPPKARIVELFPLLFGILMTAFPCQNTDVFKIGITAMCLPYKKQNIIHILYSTHVGQVSAPAC